MRSKQDQTSRKDDYKSAAKRSAIVPEQGSLGLAIERTEVTYTS